MPYQYGQGHAESHELEFQVNSTARTSSHALHIVCRTFREKNRFTPIIMLTGGPDVNLIEDSLKAGANQVLANHQT